MDDSASSEFLISIWLHLDIRQAIDNVDRNYISVKSLDSLRATDPEGSILYIVSLVLFHLSR